METWIYLFIANRILAATCPYTIKGIGQILGLVSIIACIVFIVLTFFFSKAWWYGFVACAIYFVTPMLAPKVNPYSTSTALIAYSNIGSIIAPILIVLMYLNLFGVL